MGLIQGHIAVGVFNVLSRTWLVVCCLCYLTACGLAEKISSEELALLDNPPEAVKQKQDTLTPLTLAWFKEIEAKYLSKGRSLSDEETQIAIKVGVTHPERVRVIVLKDFPIPDNRTLYSQAKQYGLGSPAESSRIMGNIIMLKARFKDERWMLAHQLSYIAQQEKMGRQEFVRRFIAEREILGSKRAPMELNASKVALDFKK